MNFNKTALSIVITYEDLECVQYKHEYAKILQSNIRTLYFGYRAAVIAGLVPDSADISLIEKEVIRNGLSDEQITKV